MNKMLQDKVSIAKAMLILDSPFYGSAVCQREIIVDPNTKTASCSARGTIRLGESFIEGLTGKQLQFLLAHEASHHMFHHLLRTGGRDHGKWNWACDAHINDGLVDAKVGEFIPGGVLHPDARNMAADDLYAIAPEGDGEGGGFGGDGDFSDEDGPLSEAEANEIQARAKVEVLQAAKAAKASKGTLPANIARLVDSIVNVVTPWHVILERYMVGMTRDDYTWARPNKRTAHMGIYLPSRGYVPKMGEVVIGVDTSVSIDQPVLDMFQGHVNRIMETCRPEKITVLYCDSSVGSSEEFTADDLPIKFTKVTGGGGTSFQPVFEYIDKEGMEPDCVVYLTDGYGDQHAFTTKHRTVWLTTGSTEFAWGEVIPFKE